MEKKTNFVVVHILLRTERKEKRNVCVRKELKKRIGTRVHIMDTHGTIMLMVATSSSETQKIG